LKFLNAQKFGKEGRTSLKEMDIWKKVSLACPKYQLNKQVNRAQATWWPQISDVKGDS